MIRRVAMILGLAWAVLLASLLVSTLRPYVQMWRWPYWDAWKFLLLQALLYGTMAFLCFAVAAALGGKGKTGEPDDEHGASDDNGS